MAGITDLAFFKINILLDSLISLTFLRSVGRFRKGCLLVSYNGQVSDEGGCDF